MQRLAGRSSGDDGRHGGPIAARRLRARRTFRPDLGDCVLEDRLTPIVPNLGVIALTTGGYMLMTPFPGAFVSPSGSPGGPGPGTASAVSGTSINLPFFILGSGGISSAIPGNFTGFPGLGAAGAASSTGSGVTAGVGSGANDASAPVITLVTRNTVANDALNPPPLIGGKPDTTAPLLPPPAPPAPAPPPPPTSASSGGSPMPPPGSSLNGPFVRWPSMPAGGVPLGLPMGAAPGAGPTAPTPGRSGP